MRKLFFNRALMARHTTFSLLLAALALPALRSHAAIAPPEKLLPDDTLVVVTVPDCTKIRETYKTSPQMQLWNDPAMKPFREKFMSKLNEELVQPLERELGVKFDSYTNLSQGQFTFAVTQNGWQGQDGQSPGLLILMDTKDQKERLKTNLTELRKKWIDSGRPIKNEKIRDTEFFILPLSDKDVPKTLRKFFSGSEDIEDTETAKTSKGELVIGQFDSLLIVGNSARPVEKVMVHLTGGSLPALGDLAAYEGNRLALFRDSPFYAWVNAKAFIDILSRKPAKTDEEENPFSATFKPDKILAATGLNGLKTLALSTQNSPDGSLVQIFIGVPGSARQGIFKIFPVELKDSGPPPFVPADAVKFQRLRIDGQKAWATIEKVMNDISPEWLAGINFLIETANAAAQEKDPSFDLKKNLIGNLGDDIISYEKSPRPGDSGLESGPSLFLLGSPNPDQLSAALKHVLVFLGQQGGAPTEREFLGRKIYTVPLPAVPVRGSGGPEGRSLSYSSSGGYVAMSIDATILEEYLRSSERPQKALRETAGLTEATAKVGGSSTGWFGFENQAETARSAFEALRKNAAKGSDSVPVPGAMDWAGQENPFKEWMDFSLLPPFEKIAKYFHFTVYSASSSVDGLTFKIFGPTPPQLRK